MGARKKSGEEAEVRNRLVWGRGGCATRARERVRKKHQEQRKQQMRTVSKEGLGATVSGPLVSQGRSIETGFPALTGLQVAQLPESSWLPVHLPRACRGAWGPAEASQG